MRIGAIAYQPYIYCTNRVSACSLGRIEALPEDGTERRIDFSGLTEEDENVNPLGKGKSANFMDILSSQMAMSRAKSAVLVKPAQEEQDAGEELEDMAAEAADDLLSRQMQQDMDEESEGMTAEAADDLFSQQDMTAAAENAGDRSGRMSGESGNPYTAYQMRHALDAYSMAMGIVA